MNFKQVNIKEALFDQKQKSNTLLDQVSSILSTSVKLDEDVLYRLQHAPVDQILDLNKLEQKLDDALSNETSESLTNWLEEKRMTNNKAREYTSPLIEELLNEVTPEEM
jgi:hypothetical protein